jgi:WD40 repeat protein
VLGSVSQPVCRDAQACRCIHLGVPPNLKTLKKVYKNSHILSILVSFLPLECCQTFFKPNVLQAQKMLRATDVRVKNEDMKQKKSLKCLFQGHEGAINCMMVVDDKLYTGSSDGTLRVWDAKDIRWELDFFANHLIIQRFFKLQLHICI